MTYRNIPYVLNLVQFDYRLPEALIAQSPLPERTSGRLLHFVRQGSEYRDLKFLDLQHLCREGDLLVLNDTQVIPARLFCKKASGGKVELLVERILDAGRGGRATQGQQVSGRRGANWCLSMT